MKITKDSYGNIEAWEAEPQYSTAYGVWAGGKKMDRLPEYFNIEFDNDNPCDCIATIIDGVG